MEQLYSTGQVARLLGLHQHVIDYAHSTTKLGEPELRFLGKRVYTIDDVRRVAKHFGVEIDRDGATAAGKEAS